MASTAQPKNTKPAVQKLELGVQRVQEFLALLVDGQKTPFAQLAKGVGSTDVTHPKRSIQKELNALEIFALAEVDTSAATLLPSGRRFRNGSTRAPIVIRNAFVAASIPKSVLATLSQTKMMTKAQAVSRLRAIDREAEIDVWLEWLEFAGFATASGDEVTMQESIMDPRTLYSGEELARLREQLYRRLAMINDSNIVANGNCFHRPIADLLAAFRAAKPEDAEPPMVRFVEAALYRLGFDVQVANGPRDSGDKLHFGTKGEDVVAFFLHPPAAASDAFNGYVIAAELKRTSSDKKAVVQALGAKGRVTTYYSSEVAVCALTVSDNETYIDKVAFDYASANNVLHVSIDALAALCEEQERRYRKPTAKLITPVDLWHVLNEFQEQNFVEPRNGDVLTAVKASADR